VRIKWFAISLLFVLTVAKGIAQACPSWGDKAGALKFLQDNKPHGTNADPTCVNRAFATLSHEKSAAKDLVGLLDFERSMQNDNFRTTSGRYPAITALQMIGEPAVPYLIKAIKESASEVVRNNAAHALSQIYRPCVAWRNSDATDGSAKTRDHGRSTNQVTGGSIIYSQYVPAFL
jgi:hypothetical protein